MKKICIFLVIVLIIVATVGYMYLNYKATYHEAQIKNAQYESYVIMEKKYSVQI